MGSLQINQVPLVTDPRKIAASLIPAAPADDTAAAIKVADLVKAERMILGVDSVPEYSTANSYAVGTFVRYNDKMYRITAAKEPGAWDAGKAIETTIYNEMSRFYGSDEEELTINITCSDGASAQGVSVSVVLGDGRTLSETCGADGNVTFRIARGSAYRIDVSAKEGYQNIPNVFMYANAVQRTIPLVFYKLGAESAYESVTLIVYRQDYGTFTTVNGKTATITCSDGSVFHPVFGNDGRATQAVPKGVTYSVQWPSVENYLTPTTVSGLSASMPSRYITCEPYMYIGDNGVFIVDADGTEYDVQSWVNAGKTGGVAIHIKDEALGGHSSVKRADGTTYGLDFFISTGIGSQSKQWCPSNVQFSLPFQNTQALATADKDGIANTAIILSDGVTKGLATPAATWCSEQTLTIGGKTGKAFLGAFGQLWIWRNVYDTFSTALTKAGGTVKELNIKSGSWWSSCQSAATHSVYMYNGSFNNANLKSPSFQCVPLFAF